MYDILYSRVPKEKILHNKNVQTIVNEEHGVRVMCADGSTYKGDILVGADGAYSLVRQSIYKQLKEKNKLPAEDSRPLPYNCLCLVGQTAPLDPEEFPEVKETNCVFNTMDSIDVPYVVLSMTLYLLLLSLVAAATTTE